MLKTSRWFLVLFLACFVSCGASLWNRSLDEVKASLERGDYNSLKTLDLATLTKSDFGQLGEGSAFSLGMIFLKLDKTPEAEFLFKTSFQKEPTPWKVEAAKALYELYDHQKESAKAEEIARKLLQIDPNSRDFQRLLVSALYWQKKDAEAWTLFNTWKAGDFPLMQERENVLFRAVLAARLGRIPEAKAAFAELLYQQEASSLHYRAVTFFEEDLARYDLIGTDGKLTLQLQSFVAQGLSQNYEDLVRTTNFSAGFWNHRVLISGFESLFKHPTRAETGLLLLEKMKPKLTGEARFAAEYARGRFYRSLERWSAARSVFQSVRTLAMTPEDQKKTSWNWLQAWVKVQPLGALGAFRQVLAETKEPEYFSDVLADWLSQLVQARAWDVVAEIYKQLGPRIEPSDRMTVGFVLARLGRHGLLDLKKENLAKTEKDLLQDCIDTEPYSYEAFIARAALGSSLALNRAPANEHQSPLSDRDDQSASVSSGTGIRDEILDKELGRLLDFGLVEMAAGKAQSQISTLPPTLFYRIAEAQQSRQMYRESLDFLLSRWAGTEEKLSAKDWELLYPRAYVEFVEPQSRVESLDPALLFGLMREESSFDARAKSWVGAVGLTQLMPDTAADVARRLRMERYDLSVPSDNIKIGARYLAQSIQTQEKIFLALMAYNAGGGRIRPWKSALGNLPEEIFVEGAPIAETRYYVKKVLSSTVMYGVLYYKKSLAQMVELVYPHFQP